MTFWSGADGRAGTDALAALGGPIPPVILASPGIGLHRLALTDTASRVIDRERFTVR